MGPFDQFFLFFFLFVALRTCSILPLLPRQGPQRETGAPNDFISLINRIIRVPRGPKNRLFSEVGTSAGALFCGGTPLIRESSPCTAGTR